MSDLEENVEETVYTRDKPAFSFQVSKRRWWDEYYQPPPPKDKNRPPGTKIQKNKNLKKGWGDLLKAKFTEHRPAGVHCSISIAGNSVVHKTEYNANMVNPGYPFNGRMYCSSKVQCRMMWYFTIETFDDLERSNKIPINVYGEGVHKHSPAHPVRGPMSGKARVEMMKTMAGMQSSASETSRNLLNQKKSTKQGAADLAAGNYDGVPTQATLRQIARQSRAEADLDENPWTNLKLQVKAVREKHGAHSVFSLSDTPFCLAWATDNMLDHLYMASKTEKPLVVGFDSTGSLISPVEWDDNKRMVLLYSLVVKVKKGPPIGVTEMVLNDQHEHEISLLFPRLLTSYQSFVTKKYHSTPRSLPFKAVVIDMSWAMTNALLKEIVGMSLVTYLHACIKAKENLMVKFTLILWCYAHYLHAISRKMGTYVPVKKKKYSPARRTFKLAMAEMARTDSVEDAVDLFRCIVIIFGSEMCTEQVTSNLEILAEKFSMSKAELEDEETADAYLKNSALNPDIPVYIPEEDRACSSLHETYQDSPFFKIFNRVYEDRLLEPVSEELEPKKNPFFVPEAINYSLRYMLPFYPFWSRYMQSMFLPDEENPQTNSAVELSFRLKKEETFVRKRYHKAARFFSKTVEDTEKRIVEYQHTTNFKKYTTNRNKRSRTAVENQDQEKDSEQIPFKKVCQEGWRKSKSVRPPHGHYSKSNAQTYASKLAGKLVDKSKASLKSSLKKNGLKRKFRLPVRKLPPPTPSADDPDPMPTPSPDDEPSPPSPTPPPSPDDDKQTSPTPSHNKRRSSLVLNSQPLEAPWLEKKYAEEGNGSDDFWFGENDRQTQTLAPTGLVDALCVDTFGFELVKRTSESGLYVSYLSPILMSEGIDSVASWALDNNLILSDVWMVPIHSQCRNHWSLLLVNMKDRCLASIDSLGPTSLEDEDLLKNVRIVMGVLAFLAKKCLFYRINWKAWKLHFCFDVPTQPNGYDCGVIICVFMSAICGLTSEPYQEKHSTKIRRWLADMIVTADTLNIEVCYRDMGGVVEGDPSELKSVMSPPEKSTTWKYVLGLRKMYVATSTHCGVGQDKCHSSNNDMFYCAGLCREWFHLPCIKEKRRKIPEIFKCSSCSQPHLKMTF